MTDRDEKMQEEILESELQDLEEAQENQQENIEVS
jgi:hypothetical protein